jgi:hypothetical protein
MRNIITILKAFRAAIILLFLLTVAFFGLCTLPFILCASCSNEPFVERGY